MIGSLVTDLIETSEERIKLAKVQSIKVVSRSSEATISLSKHMGIVHFQLTLFLRDNLYNHKNMKEMAYKSKEIIMTLVDAFLPNPKKMSNKSNTRHSNAKMYVPTIILNV